MKVLIIFLPGLGNAILLEPTLRALKTHTIDLYIKQKIVEVLYKDSGLVNKFIYHGTFPFRRYDVVVSTSAKLDWKEKLFIFLLRKNKKILYEYNPNIHEKDCHLQIAKKFGIKIDDTHPRIYIPKNTKNFLFKKDQLTIGFHPGCSEALKYKRWMPERFAKVADILSQKARIVIFGGPEEVDLSQKITKMMKSEPFILTGKTNIFETALAISHCDLFITNDSGLMHIASAMQVPTVAIFAQTNPIKNAPLVKDHIILKNDNLNKILVDDVISAVNKILKHEKSKNKFNF